MKNNLRDTKIKGLSTLLALVVIAFAVSIGFSPLFELLDGGIAAEFIASAFGAIFVIVLTMFLLNKQTEIEQESKKSERLFDEKVKIYQKILDISRDMLLDGTLTLEDINRLPFPLIRLQMVADIEVIEAFQIVFNKLNQIYNQVQDESVVLTAEDKEEVYKLLSNFSANCRKDLDISERDIEEQLKENTVKAITESGKKRDFTKFEFDGEKYNKNRYVFEVIKNSIQQNPGMTLKEFSEKIIARSVEEIPGGRKGDYEIWKTYEEAIALHKAKGSTRYFVYLGRGGDYLSDKDAVLSLKDAEICVSNQWSLDNVLPFREIMKKKGIRIQ